VPSATENDWSEELYQTFVEIAGYMNRPDIDVAFLERSGVKLDSALFPLLCRIGVLAPIGVVDLADAIGRDHSTISRQVAKLESLGLVDRSQAPDDQRVRLVRPSPGGNAMLARFGEVRGELMERRFEGWTAGERTDLLRLMKKMLGSVRGMEI